MSKNPNNSTKQLVQVLIITAVAILLVGGALIGLLNAQVAKVQADADGKQAQVGSSEQVTQRYMTTLSAYNDTTAHLKDLESSVTDASYVPTMLKQIQTLAETTHLQVTSIRPSASQAPVAKPAVHTSDPASPSSSSSASKGPAYDTINIELDVNGTYPETAAFLYDLTRFPKIVAVSSASLHPQGSDATHNPLGPPQIHSTLMVTAYLFHDEAAPAAAPGSPATIPAAASTAASTPAITPDVSSLVPASTNAATLAGTAQRAMAGATGASNAAKARAEVGVGTL